MTEYRFIGIDPGLVHTGIVAFHIDPNSKLTAIWDAVMPGIDPDEILGAILEHPNNLTFVEDYRTRGQLNTNKPMLEGIGQLRKAMPDATFLDNMGVKKVVSADLMKLLGLWDFETPTHHQDLRSAARVMLFGMLKMPQWNKVLYNIAMDTLNGQPWR